VRIARAVRVAICCTAGQGSEHRRLRGYLRAAGFAPQFIQRPDDAADRSANDDAGILILICEPPDNASAGADATRIVRQLRDAGFTAPVLVIGGIASAERAATVLDSGADDYVRLPYDPAEVVARVRVLLRRSYGLAWLGRAHESPVLDRWRHVVADGKVEIALTPRETAVLECLIKRAGRPVSRDELAACVWGAEPGSRGETNIVDVYVAYLRRKLKALGQTSILRSVRGVGYELVVPSPASIPGALEANVAAGRPPERIGSVRAGRRGRKNSGEHQDRY
jgi:DNA-binding response OmpR family regulator